MSENNNRLVPLLAAHDLTEAYIAKGILATSGIQTAIFDENTYAANPFYSVAIGGVRVMVNEIDFEAAFKILKQEFNEELELLPEYLKEKELAEIKEWVQKDPELMNDITLLREVLNPIYVSDDEIAFVIREVCKPRRSFFARLLGRKS